jgi:hypothetical protein
LKKNTKKQKSHSIRHKIIDIAPLDAEIAGEEERLSALSQSIAPTIQSKPPIINPSLGYQNNGGIVSRPEQRRHVFEPTEYDLYEIGRIEDVEAYVRQAFKKQVGLFLKEGFDYLGSNKNVVKYLKARFSQIERASSIPHEELIRRIASSLVRKSNAFLVKVRSVEASGGRIRTNIDGKRLFPVAGYFPVPAETMQAKTDGSGKPYRWRQMLPNGTHLEFEPEDIVHFHFDRKEGFIFGTPLIQPVIDDIRALRKIEENIELLIYKHLFPLFQYIVGTEKAPALITETGEREIDVVKRELMQMPTEGGIVTPERHEIKAIGSESKALRAESYLEHFKKRVIAGLGMSSVDFGEADTSNKSTADNMSRLLIDNIKDLQDSFEAQFNLFIINELLEESTFGMDVLKPENIVRLEFREVDIDKQIKMENHAVDVFTKHGLTWDELRKELGRDPILVPDDPETQDREHNKEWFNTFWKLFHEPEKLINAGDESYSSLAMGAAKSVSTAVTSADVEASRQAKTNHEVTVAVEKEKAKPKPVIKKKDSFLREDYRNMEDIVVHEIQNNNIVNMDYINQKLLFSAQKIKEKLISKMNVAFLEGLGNNSHQYLSKISITRTHIINRVDVLIKRLVHDIRSAINSKIDFNTQNVKISTVHSIFDSFEYRIDFITQAEISRANNFGKITQVKELGAIKAKYTVQEDTCQSCKDISMNHVHLEQYTLDTVPPHHPNCTCGLQITEVQ